MKKAIIYCDSADLITNIMIKSPKKIHQRGTDYCYIDKDVDLLFKIPNKNNPLPKKVSNQLNTYGTMDYIVCDEHDNVISAIEDTKTAPVGNALLQRMDKVLPLFLNRNRKFKVAYIAPRIGKDDSQDTERSVCQSWFFQKFLKNYGKNFIFLEKNQLTKENICDHTLNLIIEHVLSNTAPIIPQNKHLVEALNESIKSVRTLKKVGADLIFSGKMFKPNNSTSHPVHSTLMTIIMLNQSTGLYNKIILETSKDHSQLLDSRNKNNKKVNFIKNNTTRRVV